MTPSQTIAEASPSRRCPNKEDGVHKKRLLAVASAGLMFGSVIVTSASAEVAGTSGQMEYIAAPASVSEGFTESDSFIRVFDERQDYVLPSPVAVDITSTGTYDDPGDLTPGAIAAGTKVDSHFFHLDKVGNSMDAIVLEGTTTFKSDILGVIVTRTNLDASDAVTGAPGTIYPQGNDTNQREVDIEGEFDFVIQPDMRTVTLHGRVTAGVDHVRILTLPGNANPNCSGVTASPNKLWPPNHKFHLVTLSGGTDPDGDPVKLTVTGVTQDEPLNGLGDGDTSPDAKVGTKSNNVYVRAERSGKLDGRVYAINFTGSDGKGGTCTGTALVGVPHDQGGKITPINSGQNYNSFG
jgi:hypothetical protein